MQLRLLFAIFIFFFPISGYGEMYSDCVFSWEFSSVSRNITPVRPVGDICYNRCQAECAPIKDYADGPGLNNDKYDACITTCQAGNTYSTTLRKKSTNNSWLPYQNGTTVTTGSACTTSGIASAAYNYYNTKFKAKEGDKVNFRLLTASETSNQVFLCGMKSVKIYPNFYAFNHSTWNNNSSWQYRDTSISTWNSRNSNWTDTGIDIKDGDYLSITYGWNYQYCPVGICFPHKLTLNLYVRPPFTDWNWDANSALSIPGDSLKFATKKENCTDQNGNLKQECANTIYIVSPKEAADNNANISFLGLKSRTWSDPRTVVLDGVSQTENINTVEFAGILSDFSPRWNRLGIMHWDAWHSPKNNRGNWDDNLGGLAVDITWRGCRYQNGERLQYAIVPLNDSDKLTDTYDPSDPKIAWFDVSKKAINPGKNQEREQVVIQGGSNSEYKEGVVFFRIKPLSYETSKRPNCNSLSSICQSSKSNAINYYNANNTSGEYYVQVEKTISDGIISGALREIVDTINDFFFEEQGGIITATFNNIVGNNQFIQIVRALLVFYIAYTGLSFMIGIAPITQQEGAVRLIKIGIVVTLISPGSWEFFNTYLFKVFTKGSLDLIAYVVAENAAEIPIYRNDPSLIFNAFDRTFSSIFSAPIWIKIYAIIFSSLTGFLIAVIVAASCVIYAAAILKIIMMYLVSLLAIALLLMMAPIFISFVLFSYTRQFFDNWIKSLISYTLQPIFVFALTSITSKLLEICFIMTFSFTACKICVLGFSITGWDMCLIPGYKTITSMHFPDQGISMPVRYFGVMACFFILAQATYALAGYSARLAGQIVTGFFLGLDLEGFGQKISPMSAASSGLNVLQKATGTDKESRNARAAERQNRRN